MDWKKLKAVILLVLAIFVIAGALGGLLYGLMQVLVNFPIWAGLLILFLILVLLLYFLELD